MGDWVVQPESWPSTFNLPSSLGLNLRIDEFAGMPLTVDNFVVNGTNQQRYRERQDSKRTSTTRGFVHFWLGRDQQSGPPQNVFLNSWITEVIIRVAVVVSDPIDATTITPQDNYSLRTPSSANEDFLFEYRTTLGNLQESEWSGSPASRTPWHWTVPVHCRVGRHLRPLENLCLWVGWLSINDPILSQPDDDTVLNVIPRMRTYMR